MSTMTLQLPNSFFDIDSVEMEYIEGGGGTITFVINKNVIVAAATIGATAAASAALSAGGVTAAASVVAVPALAALITNVLANGALKKPSYTLPIYISNHGIYLALMAASGWDGKMTLKMQS